MPEWLVENGIGEQRAILLDQGEIAAARIQWPGQLAAGQVEDARLISRVSGSTRGTARFSSGQEALVDRLPRDASEGATLRLKIVRSAIGEAGRLKLAHARPSEDPVRPAPDLAELLEQDGAAVRTVHRFPGSDWDHLIADAFSRTIPFDQGELLLCPTPAMTLIDIDGTSPPTRLALDAVPAIASAVMRLDIGGAVGIDFPSLQQKADRRVVDDALNQALLGWPHERTAMNGFGFVQIVSRLERPSILHLATGDSAGLAARLLLRRAEATDGPGAILLCCHPSVAANLTPEWLTELARRTGREIRVQADAGLAPEAGFAQAVPL